MQGRDRVLSICTKGAKKQDGSDEKPESTLSIQMKGVKVARHHERLQRRGGTIPQKEIEKHYFGAGTKKAVLGVQTQHGLKTDGVVDEVTAL